MVLKSAFIPSTVEHPTNEIDRQADKNKTREEAEKIWVMAYRNSWSKRLFIVTQNPPLFKPQSLRKKRFFPLIFKGFRRKLAL
jgi:hypothetical protein